MRYEVKQWCNQRISEIGIALFTLLVACGIGYLVYRFNTPTDRYKLLDVINYDTINRNEDTLYLLDSRTGKTWVYSEKLGKYWSEIGGRS